LNSLERCKAYRRRILELSQRVQALHIGGAFSCIEIVDAIYRDLLKPGDTFVMSKGHGAIAQYIVLESLGVLTREQVDGYCTNGGILGCHPDRGNPGIEASTGALGHGLAMAVGMAHADRAHTVYCLLSDGECQEGSTWEAAIVAASLRLSNLVCFVDNNDMNSMGRISELQPALYPLKDKWKAFDWEVLNAPPDYSFMESSALLNAMRTQPIVFIVQTQKGAGVSFMAAPMWHYRSPNKEEYEAAMRELA
jgi:transketolase